MKNIFFMSLKVMLAGRLASLLFFSCCFVLFSSVLAAEFGGRQPVTLALDVGLSVLRLVVPVVVVILVQELFSREFDKKYYQIGLSYPVARVEWFLGRFFSLLCVVSVFLVVLAGVLLAVVKFVGGEYGQLTPVDTGFGFWVVIFFVFLDFLVLAAVSSFLGIFASTSSFVLIGTIGFMLIARSYSAVLAMLTAGAGNSYGVALGGLGFFIPDLAGLDVRMVALYSDIGFLGVDHYYAAAGSLAYAVFFVVMGAYFFNRKALS